MKKSEIAFGLIRIPVDFLLINLAFLAAFKLRAIGDFVPFVSFSLTLETFPDLYAYLQFTSISALALIFFLAFNEGYTLRATVSVTKESKRILLSCFVWFTSILAYYFLTRTFPFSRLVLIYSFIFTVIFLIFGREIVRIIQNYLASKGIGRRNILILGDNKISEILESNLKKSSYYNVFLSKKLIYQYSIEMLSKVVSKYNIEEIIQTENKIKDKDAADTLDFCKYNHIQYNFVPDLLEVQRSNVDFFSISGIPIMSLKPTSLDGWARVIKRIFDVVLSLIALTMLSPVFILTIIAIKIDSKGPILFTKLDDGSPAQRVGEKGKLFKFYKFRSMHPNTHNLRYTELAPQNCRNGSPLVKIKNDPRVTRVGRFIRKFSIDELPQLFNVIKGDISLVGPRAHLPEEVAAYNKHHKFVLTIKPGITGLAQISGRSNLDFEREVELDTYYIENWSLMLDLKILIKTVAVVLSGRGAD